MKLTNFSKSTLAFIVLLLMVSLLTCCETGCGESKVTITKTEYDEILNVRDSLKFKLAEIDGEYKSLLVRLENDNTTILYKLDSVTNIVKNRNYEIWKLKQQRKELFDGSFVISRDSILKYIPDYLERSTGRRY